jgi:hypothetical protein
LPDTGPVEYQSLPWYRKAPVAHFLAIAGFVAFPPLLWGFALICLTGPVYRNERDKNGQLVKWGNWAKYYAIVVLILHSLFLYIAWSMWHDAPTVQN